MTENKLNSYRKMATKKAGGTVKLGRDSQSKRLGVKAFDGQAVAVGNILIRQRGTKFFAGKNTKYGGDDTIYAMKNGTIKFSTKTRKRFDGTRKEVKVINVL